MNTPENTETALVLYDSTRFLRWDNEVAQTWRGIERNRCRHRETTQGPMCLGPSFYVDICNEDYCEAHAEWAMEGDAAHIEEELEFLKEGLRKLAARGATLPTLSARVLSRISPEPFQGGNSHPEHNHNFPQVASLGAFDAE